jgi:ABC-type phosphate transport system auxiliary subunit
MTWQDVLKGEGFYFSPVFIEKIDVKKKKKLKKLIQKAQPTNMMGEDMTHLSDIIEELKGIDLVKSDKKLSKTVDGFDEKNLDILASASELRKDYETLYSQLRKMVYPKKEKKKDK